MSSVFQKLTDLKQIEPALERLYGAEALAMQRGRYAHLLEGFAATFGARPALALFSAPGRTEIGGNHTDHELGRVLAGSLNLDVIAAVAPNEEGVIRIQSEGFPMDEIALDALEARVEEKNRSAALIRGVAARFAALGAPLSGLDVYTTSNVLKGSGMSSSAAFEILIGTILNELFYDGKCTPVELAKIGQYAENVYFGKPCGLLDQMGSAVGNMVTIDFYDPEKPVVERVDFDFAAAGYALCIIDSLGDHAELTHEYASVTEELGLINRYFDKPGLCHVLEDEFMANLPQLREIAGDRAVLRAFHIYADSARVGQQVEALKAGDFDAFLRLIRESGLSSWRFLQNVTPTGATRQQELAFALGLCERLLNGRGACRVHGGGFAGTLQAFVPNDMLEGFRTGIEAVLGAGACHVLAIRPVGGVRIL